MCFQKRRLVCLVFPLSTWFLLGCSDSSQSQEIDASAWEVSSAEESTSMLEDAADATGDHTAPLTGSDSNEKLSSQEILARLSSDDYDSGTLEREAIGYPQLGQQNSAAQMERQRRREIRERELKEKESSLSIAEAIDLSLEETANTIEK